MCPPGRHVLLGRMAPSDMRIGGVQTGERSGGACCGDGAHVGTEAQRERRRKLRGTAFGIRRGGEQRGKALGHRLIDSLEEMAALGQERADGVTHRRNRSRTYRACERIDALHAAPVSGRSGSVGTVTTAIEVEDLSKSYGDLRAVDGVSFSVEPGEVFAILGPNGAGKSTTVEILEGHRRRDSGRVSVLGVDPTEGGRAFRNRIGIVLQEAGVDKELTVRETLDLYSTAYTRRRSIDEVIEMVELADKLDERISRLSGGQQRRVDLALGVIGAPDVLFLDEPTTGFDPAARRRSWELVRDLADNGTTIVLTTHYLEEAEELADHLIVMAGGTIVAAGTPESLRDQAGEATIIRFALPSVDASLAGLLDPLHGDASGRDRRLEISTTKPTADLAHITGWALQHGIELDGLSVESVTLEDVYLRLVGTDS